VTDSNLNHQVQSAVPARQALAGGGTKYIGFKINQLFSIQLEIVCQLTEGLFSMFSIVPMWFI
jgi:hypothetical protein